METTPRCPATDTEAMGPTRQNYPTFPQSAMTTLADVLPLDDPTASIFRTTSYPFTTCPNTTCLPSRCGVSEVQRKNCDPFVFGPAFAIERVPGPKCLPALPANV